MKPPTLGDHPKLRKFLRTVPAGETLFRQGEMGSTMFLLLEGSVELVAERDGLTHITAMVEPGGFLGERAIVTREPYIRYYSARTHQDSTMLEIGSQDLAFLKVAAPDVMTDIMTRAFEVAAERLQRMNFLARVLRSTDERERFYGCILYFCQTAGAKVAEGLEVPLSAAGISYYCGNSVGRIEDLLAEVEKENLIQRHSDGFYLIKDLKPLMTLVPWAAPA